MLTRAQRACAAIAFLCAAAFPRPAAADTRPPWELFAGYALLRDARQDLCLPAGWTAAVARAVNGWLSIVADAGGNYRTVSLVDSDAKLAAHSILGGGRASARIGKLVEFGEVLAGAVRTSGTVYGASNSETHAAVQGGAGVDVALAPRLTARGELDARFFGTGPQIRLVAGVAYRRMADATVRR